MSLLLAYNEWLFSSKSLESKWKGARGTVMCIWEEENGGVVGDWGRVSI